MPETISERVKARADANEYIREAARQTLDDISKAYRGVTHSVNRCNAEYSDCWKEIQSLRDVVEQLTSKLAASEEARTEAEAAIAQLTERTEALEGSMDKSREAYQALAKQVRSRNTPS